MLGLSFLSPFLLGALFLLPAIWWLLRLTPPRPRHIFFPGFRFLKDIESKRTTPVQTPLWLLLFRLFLAALIIVGLAGPVLKSISVFVDDKPLLLIVDNDWSTAQDWKTRQDTLLRLVDHAKTTGQKLSLWVTASEKFYPENSRLRSVIKNLEPVPWPTRRAQIPKNLPKNAQVLWLSNGLEAEDDSIFFAHLSSFDPIFITKPSALPVLLLPSEGWSLQAVRADKTIQTVTVEAVHQNGQIIATQTGTFKKEALTLPLRFEIPEAYRNRITRFRLKDHRGAASIILNDERWRHRVVGIWSDDPREHHLLDSVFYLEQALSGFSTIIKGHAPDLLAQNPSMLIRPNIHPINKQTAADLKHWIAEGGVLLQFVDDNMTTKHDEFLPVKLRAEARHLGGALSWENVAKPAPFLDHTPFKGLHLPADLTVSRQVLAEPDSALKDKTWMALDDETPLITAEARGKGWVILVHTTANTNWSNLCLSGVFADMLERLARLSEGRASFDEPLPPVSVLNGFGHIRTPGTNVLPLAPDDTVSKHHPPGFYGNARFQYAFNLTDKIHRITPMVTWPEKAQIYTPSKNEIPLQTWILSLAFFLVLFDTLLSIRIRGLWIVLLGFLWPVHSMAEPHDLYLAYIITDDQKTDSESYQGLSHLSTLIRHRTVIETVGAKGVYPERDDLVFFPFLYWPVTPTQKPLSTKAIQKLNHYLKTGGTILFDTKHPGLISTSFFQDHVRGLRIPPLSPIPKDHVLTKSFYLLKHFPGRFEGDTVWVEKQGTAENDHVSTVIVGSHDWASAWAPQSFYNIPEQQREMAQRFGINLIMYTLTGNYKADQVHVPFILKKLQQK